MYRTNNRNRPFAVINRIGAGIVRIGTESRHQKAFVIGLIGLGLIVAHHVPRIWTHLPEAWPSISLEIGIAFVIAAIAEFILLEHAVAAIREEIQREKQLVSHCSRHHLVDVIAPRTQKDSSALNEIERALRGAQGDVCILGLSLQDFLTHHHMSNSGLLPLLNEMIATNKVRVRMLLVDPNSSAVDALGYAARGPSSSDQTELRWRVCNSIHQIDRMKTTGKGKQIEARFHNTLPGFYMISTANALFMEPYHFGAKPNSLPYSYGSAPILRFGPQSAMYQLALSHFSYIWNSEETTSDGSGRERCDGRFIRVRTLEQVLPEAERRRDVTDRRSHPNKVHQGPERRSYKDRRFRKRSTASVAG